MKIVVRGSVAMQMLLCVSLLIIVLNMLVGNTISNISNTSSLQTKDIGNDSRGIAVTLNGGYPPPYPEANVRVYCYATGEFRMATLENRQLLFPGFNDTGSSYWSFRWANGTTVRTIDPDIYEYIDEPMHLVPDGTKRAASISYKFDNLYVTLTYTLINNGTKITISVENHDGEPCSFGARYLYDVCNSDPSLYTVSHILLPNHGVIDHEMTFDEINAIYYPATGFEYFTVLENYDADAEQANYWATSWLGPKYNATVPTRVTIANWSRAYYESIWAYESDPTEYFTNLSNPDNCVLVYWELESIAPGDISEIITYFGWGLPSFADFYDISLTPRVSGDTLIREIDPGGTANFELIVWNSGTIDFEFNVSMSCITVPGWSATIAPIEPGEYTLLTACNFIRLNLLVTAPVSNVEGGDFVNITVTVKVKDKPDLADNVITQTRLILKPDFIIEFIVELAPGTDEKTLYLHAGECMTVAACIKNIGNVNDSYALVLLGAPEGWITNFSVPSPLSGSGSTCSWLFYLDPNTSLWTASCTLGATQFSGSDIATIDIIIIANLTATPNDEITLTLRCVSLSFGIVRYDSITVKILPNDILILSCKTPIKYGDPGENIDYVFTVELNAHGVLTLNITFMIEILECSYSHDWEIIRPPYAILNTDNGITHIDRILYVRSSLYSYAGASIHIKVRILGTVHSDSTAYCSRYISDPVIIVAVVNQIYDIGVAIVPQRQSAIPGETISYELQITNYGNGDDKVQLSAIMPHPTWGHRYLRGGVVLSQAEPVINCERGTTELIILEVIVPNGTFADAMPDTIDTKEFYAINLTFSSSNELQRGTIWVDVIQIYDIRLDYTYKVEMLGAGMEQEPEGVIVPDNVRELDPGRGAAYTFIVANDGNGIDRFKLNISQIFSTGSEYSETSDKSTFTDDWLLFFSSIKTAEKFEAVQTVNFSDVVNLIDAYGSCVSYTPATEDERARELTVELYPGQYVWVNLVVMAPFTALEGTYKFNVKGQSLLSVSEDLTNSTLTFTVTIKKSDLVVADDINIHGKLEAGELITITVWIMNQGDIDAWFVLVKLYIDGKEVSSAPFDKIMPGQKRMAMFSWHGKRGTHTIKVVIDPDNLIIEKDEANNEKTRKINIKGERKLFEPGFEANGVIIATIILMVILSVFRKFRSSPEPSAR